MSMKLNKKERLAKDLLGHLQDPEFQDVKIICLFCEDLALRPMLDLL